FPTGGYICGRAGILNGYTTGRGTIINRAKLHTEQQKGGKTLIVVDEMPYQILKQTVIDRIVAAVKGEALPDISDVRDESDREKAIRLVLELKREADPQVVINQLYKHTPLQSTFSIMNIVLVNGRPLTLPIKDMLEQFIEHRKNVIRRRTIHLLGKARQRAHILEGLILAVSDIDEIIQLIKSSPDAPTAKDRLMNKPLRLDPNQRVKLDPVEAARIHGLDPTSAVNLPAVECEFDLRRILPAEFLSRVVKDAQFFSGPQADAILSMQLQRLTGLEIWRLIKEYKELADEIAGYEKLLSDERLILDVIREDCYEIKEKYGDARRTEIIDEAGDFDIEDLIAEEHVVVTISHDGYIKRMPLDTYRRQGRGGRGIRGSETKDEDFIEHLFTAVTHDYLLVFTNRGRVYWQKVYDVPQMSRTSKGRAIVNLLNMQSDEKIAAILPVREFGSGYVFLATRKGIVKKTPLEDYDHPLRRGIIVCQLKTADDEVIGAALTSGSQEIILGTRGGQAARFKETEVRPMGRQAGGVYGIDLADNDEVVGMAVADSTASVLTVCENGYGKRTEFEEYRLTHRGSKGVINIKQSERNGPVVAVKCVRNGDELMMISGKGIVTRMAVDTLRTIGRATQGVILQRLDEGDKLVAVTRIAPESLGGEGQGEPPPAEGQSAEADQSPAGEEALGAEPDDNPAEDQSEPTA
ncbi:MAG: DNA gyrase C-terminal beta-propeller domain-containing protein, partial [Phycisphaerae bacterium]|nr:DNA gyrase C-terminal beta-propeller domain-containing protein [Phycisphaerae bacterium]